jgi:hypothetical protein
MGRDGEGVWAEHDATTTTTPMLTKDTFEEREPHPYLHVSLSLRLLVGVHVGAIEYTFEFGKERYPLPFGSGCHYNVQEMIGMAHGAPKIHDQRRQRWYNTTHMPRY